MAHSKVVLRTENGSIGGLARYAHTRFVQEATGVFLHVRLTPLFSFARSGTHPGRRKRCARRSVADTERPVAPCHAASRTGPKSSKRQGKRITAKPCQHPQYCTTFIDGSYCITHPQRRRGPSQRRMGATSWFLFTCDQRRRLQFSRGHCGGS